VAATAPQKYHQCGLTPSTLSNSVKYFFVFICFNYWKKMRTGKKEEKQIIFVSWSSMSHFP
jgi:hypothetical protein